MDKVSVSVIIPTKNVSENIGKIIKAVSKGCGELAVEYIIVDMNSSDSTAVSALKAISLNGLNGFVLQNGSSTVGSALNTGIYKAAGEYISFVFARTLYSDFIPEYYRLAQENDADFVFASSKLSEEERAAAAEAFSNIGGEALTEAMARSLISVELPAIMLRSDFIRANRILFSESCRRGYAEQYVYKIALSNPKTAFSDFKLEKDTENQAPIKDTDEGNKELHVLERIDAMKETAELAETRFGENKELCDLLRYGKLPEVSMSCIDALLKSGVKPSLIKAAMKVRHSDEALETSRSTPFRLKKRIFIWKRLPRLYRPK